MALNMLFNMQMNSAFGVAAICGDHVCAAFLELPFNTMARPATLFLAGLRLHPHPPSIAALWTRLKTRKSREPCWVVRGDDAAAAARRAALLRMLLMPEASATAFVTALSNADNGDVDIILQRVLAVDDVEHATAALAQALGFTREVVDDAAAADAAAARAAFAIATGCADAAPAGVDDAVALLRDAMEAADLDDAVSAGDGAGAAHDDGGDAEVHAVTLALRWRAAQRAAVEAAPPAPAAAQSGGGIDAEVPDPLSIGGMGGTDPVADPVSDGDLVWGKRILPNPLDDLFDEDPLLGLLLPQLEEEAQPPVPDPLLSGNPLDGLYTLGVHDEVLRGYAAGHTFEASKRAQHAAQRCGADFAQPAQCAATVTGALVGERCAACATQPAQPLTLPSAASPRAAQRCDGGAQHVQHVQPARCAVAGGVYSLATGSCRRALVAGLSDTAHCGANGAHLAHDAPLHEMQGIDARLTEAELQAGMDATTFFDMLLFEQTEGMDELLPGELAEENMASSAADMALDAAKSKRGREVGGGGGGDAPAAKRSAVDYSNHRQPRGW